MKVVFDTNIFISALVFPGHQAEKAVVRVIEKDTLVISKAIIDEVLSVLSPKFSRDAEELSRLAVFLADMGEFVKPLHKVKALKDEPDNGIIECAVDGHAYIIITDDKEMLSLKKYRGVQIIGLKDYLEM
ncbi:MAG TPA: putative toxin-antitoxin system toxin component, PIN family [Dissulfurispiraceae bacterium]|nr:putative toxin-antitoxin system toxin component, PIN family [Dissulfurispiraceae bacterium]